MTIEQQIRDAFADLDELLLEGFPIEAAVTEAATSNGVKPKVLAERAKRQFGELEAHRANLARVVEWREQEHVEQRALAARIEHVREAAITAAESTYYACCLNDPEHAGQPSWPYCIDRLSEGLGFDDGRCREAIREAVYATVEHLDRKHGTHTAHYR